MEATAVALQSLRFVKEQLLARSEAMGRAVKME